MKVLLVIPTEERRVYIEVEEQETVIQFRKKVAQFIGLDKQFFLLIAFGKVLNDKCADNLPASLHLTYRVRDKTSVIVHKTLPQESKKLKAASPSVKKPTINVVRDMSVVTEPLEAFFCTTCKNKKKRCVDCGCQSCFLKTGDPMICDQCDSYWHVQCAGLKETPNEDYWYCPNCINTDVSLIVGKDKRIQNPKPLDALSLLREVECAIVPRNHVGKIPGVYCGQLWENITVCSEWGVHRTSSYSSRVLGSQDTGAVSIFLYRNSRNPKTYEDKGYEFTLSGLGAVSKSVNLMAAKTLVRQDLKLALTCDAPLNDTTGAHAINWQKSRPIRVCRANFDKKVYDFEPEHGVRYDGLYKVVSYWPIQCKSLHQTIWKFKLRRDDDELAPWLEQSRKLNLPKGLRMIYEDREKTQCLVRYKIPDRILDMMSKDKRNKRIWDQLQKTTFYSEFELIHHLFENVIVCSSDACAKPIMRPIITPCGHICCKRCLSHSKSETCFTCRSPLPLETFTPNQQLINILRAFSPTYGEDTEKIICPARKYELTNKKRKGEDDHLKQKRVRIVLESV
ncbi:PUA-like domain-containing protein [Sporodiniella umbellata]|nr:PUA-like domain-containing protein [Sporodiniella umbellata]